MNRITIGLGYLLTVVALAGSPAFAEPPGTLPSAPGLPVSSQAVLPRPGTGNFTERLIRQLRSHDLEVSVGYSRVYTPADCAYTYPVFHNCLGNNPASPYVMPVVKSWPEEYVDPAMENGLGRTRPGYSVTYRLDPREAIIWFGRMPPPARYMGLQTWIVTTRGVNESPPPLWNEEEYDNYSVLTGEMTSYFFDTVPGNPDRLQSFSSIDNNINNVVMEKQSGSPWDEIRYFVITPDQSMDAEVREALVALGVDGDEIFTERIPASFEGGAVGPLGLDDQAVDFTTALRYAMPDDEKVAAAWLKSLPIHVLRVRRSPGGGDFVPYGDREADVRDAVDETQDDALVSGLTSLIAAVTQRAQSQGWTREENLPMIDILNSLGQFGPECRKIGMNCLADGQDASYYFARPRSLDTGRIYAAVGTLATETGNGTYVGLSINDASLLKGALNVDDAQLKGSASSYHSEVPNPDTLEKFFVQFFARDCAAIADLTYGACTTIDTDMIPLAGDDTAPGNRDLHGKFSMAVRAYVKRDSERGPDPTKQLPPHSLSFYFQQPAAGLE